MKTVRRILVLRLQPFGKLGSENGAAERVRVWIERERATGAEITILASSATLTSFQGLDVTVWPDGAPNGVLRLLALVRRISWGEFSAVYDFDGSRRTKAYRLFVRPCPPWHSAEDLKAL